VISTRSKTGTTWVQMICALPCRCTTTAATSTARVRQLTGQPGPAGPPPPRQPLHDWLLGWIASDDDPRQWPDSLPGVMRHFRGAWARRDEPSVLLVHYDSLSTDLEGQMRRLAAVPGIDPDRGMGGRVSCGLRRSWRAGLMTGR
jgi:hypothetical protein